jgi:hypothetical protein
VNLNMTESRTPGELAESLEYRELLIVEGTAGQQGSAGSACFGVGTVDKQERADTVLFFLLHGRPQLALSARQPKFSSPI